MGRFSRPLAPSAIRGFLGARDVLFQEIRVLESRELDGKTAFDVAHDASWRLSERDQSTDRRDRVARDRGARKRHIHDLARDRGTVRHGDGRARVAGHDALMFAIGRQAQDVPVGKPGELGGATREAKTNSATPAAARLIEARLRWAWAGAPP